MADVNLLAPLDSAKAEQYRVLRSRLLNRATPYSGQRIFGIVSPAESFEPMLIAANLAVSVAESGRSVALIDADLRPSYGSLDQVFEIDPAGGLAGVLSQESDEIEVPWQAGSRELLQILCAGSLGENHPGDLLLSPRLSYFLEHMRETADLVLVNLPALEHPESFWVASQMDGVLLVVERGKSRHRQLAEAQSRLTEIGTPIMGSVLVSRPSVG